MRIHNLYFSPTGGTKTVADIITHALGDEVSDIDLSLYHCDYSGCIFGSGELCVVSVPAFGGRIPPPALQALRQLHGLRNDVILVVTYGNRHYDDALLELRNTLVKAGFHVIAGIAAVTEHSIIRQFGAGRPDAADREELIAFANKLKSSFRRGYMLPSADIPGKEPYREYGGVPMKPVAGRKCTACGLCAEKCPVGAITAASPRGVKKSVCISCMRCVAICPNGARKVSRLLLRAASDSLEKVCSERKSNLLFFKS